MKKIASGAATIIVGAILFLSMCITVASSPFWSVGGTWSGNRFWAAITNETGLTFLFVISVVVMLLGIGLLVWGNFEKSNK